MNDLENGDMTRFNHKVNTDSPGHHWVSPSSWEQVLELYPTLLFHLQHMGADLVVYGCVSCWNRGSCSWVLCSSTRLVSMLFFRVCLSAPTLAFTCGWYNEVRMWWIPLSLRKVIKSIDRNCALVEGDTVSGPKLRLATLASELVGE